MHVSRTKKDNILVIIFIISTLVRWKINNKWISIWTTRNFFYMHNILYIKLILRISRKCVLFSLLTVTSLFCSYIRLNFSPTKRNHHCAYYIRSTLPVTDKHCFAHVTLCHFYPLRNHHCSCYIRFTFTRYTIIVLLLLHSFHFYRLPWFLVTQSLFCLC